MLRINLLPAYIAERRKVSTAIAVAVVVWLLVLGGGLGYNFGVLQLAIAQRETEATEQEQLAQKEQAFEQETTQTRSKVAPLKANVDFVEAVRYHNRIRQKIFRQAANYTYREVELNSMAVTGNSLAVGAVAKSLADIGRFYIYMFGNPDVTAVSISGVPGYADIQKQTPVRYPGGPAPLPPAFSVGMSATLVKAVTAPELPAGLSGGTGGGASGAGGFGGPPGISGPPPGEGGPPADSPPPADSK